MVACNACATDHRVIDVTQLDASGAPAPISARAAVTGEEFAAVAFTARVETSPRVRVIREAKRARGGGSPRGRASPSRPAPRRQRARIRANSGPAASPRASRCRPEHASCGPASWNPERSERGEEPLALLAPAGLLAPTRSSSAGLTRARGEPARELAIRLPGRALARELHGSAVVPDQREHLGRRARSRRAAARGSRAPRRSCRNFDRARRT